MDLYRGPVDAIWHLPVEGLLHFFGDDLIKANLGTYLSASVRHLMRIEWKDKLTEAWGELRLDRMRDDGYRRQFRILGFHRLTVESVRA